MEVRVVKLEAWSSSVTPLSKLILCTQYGATDGNDALNFTQITTLNSTLAMKKLLKSHSVLVSNRNTYHTEHAVLIDLF